MCMVQKQLDLYTNTHICSGSVLQYRQVLYHRQTNALHQCINVNQHQWIAYELQRKLTEESIAN